MALSKKEVNISEKFKKPYPEYRTNLKYSIGYGWHIPDDMALEKFTKLIDNSHYASN